MAANVPVNSFLHAVRAQLAATPTRTHSPRAPKSGFWHWVGAALAFRPIYAQSNGLVHADSNGLLASIQQIVDSPASQRLHHRHAINRLADYLAHPHDGSLARDLDRAKDHARANARDLDRVRAYDLANTLDLAETLALDPAVTHALARASANARELAETLDLLSAIDPVDRTKVRPRTVDYGGRSIPEICARANALDHDLGLALADARTLVDALGQDATDVFADTLNQAYALARASDLDHNLVNALDDASKKAGSRYLSHANELTIAIEQLQNAANDFSGADLRQSRLDVVDLSWLRWDKDTTQWPEAWTERIHNASLEQPEGSGHFVILPAFDNDLAAFPTNAL